MTMSFRIIPQNSDLVQHKTVIHDVRNGADVLVFNEFCTSSCFSGREGARLKRTRGIRPHVRYLSARTRAGQPVNHGIMGILPMLKGCRQGRLRYAHGLRARATATASRPTPWRRALAGALLVSHGL